VKRKRIVRTAEVIIETEEKLYPAVAAQRRFQRSTLVWCPSCRRQVEMVTPERAAEIAGVSTRTIRRWCVIGKVHASLDGQNATFLVCQSSLGAIRTGEGEF